MAPEEAVPATGRFRDGIQYIAARFFAVPVQVSSLFLHLLLSFFLLKSTFLS